MILVFDSLGLAGKKVLQHHPKNKNKRSPKSMHFQPGGAALCSEYIELSTLHPGFLIKGLATASRM